MNSMRQRILGLALPNIISNISVPLLSIADTAIAGRMASESSLGAVSTAATLFSFTIWLWGFLRMATTGFTAQAYGREDTEAQSRQLSVGTFIALLGGLLIMSLAPLLLGLLPYINEGAPSLLPEARTYLKVALWGAPAALLLYVYNAWFIGMQNTLIPMISTIVGNVLNIASSFAFVYFGDMGVEGIALGTVVSQYVSVLVLLSCALLRYREVFARWHWRQLLSAGEVFSYIHIAKYLILRTLMMGSINLFFVKAGSSYGAIAVGGNTVLMQLFLTFSYFMDGFAYAGEALTGRYVGARDGASLREMLRQLFAIGAVLAPLVMGLYFVWGDVFLAWLCKNPSVLSYTLEQKVWVTIVPIVSFMSFLWDGVFVGMTKSKPMMQAVSLACLSFYVCYFLGRNAWGVDALWLAFVVYLAIRSLFSTYCGLRLVRAVA